MHRYVAVLFLAVGISLAHPTNIAPGSFVARAVNYTASSTNPSTTNSTINDVQTEALGKANEYPTANCKDMQGGNKPTYPHKPACGCIQMDSTTASVYIATSPGQKVHAFANKACNPGRNKEDYLGTLGGKCRSLEDEFPNQGVVQGVLFWTPVVCDVAEFFSDLPEHLKEVVLEIIDIVA